MKLNLSLVAGVIVGYLAHKKVDWVLMSAYENYPSASRFIVGMSVGMGVYFLSQELPSLIKKLHLALQSNS